MKTNTAKKKPGRPSERKTTLAVLRAMLTVRAEHKGRFLKRKGHYEVERVALPVSTVAKWLNVSEETVRCIERGRKGYPLTPERANIISYQTRVSDYWLLQCKPKAKPLNCWFQPFTQADFDARQIELTNESNETKQGDVSFNFVKGIAWLAAIMLLASQKGKFQIYVGRVQTVFEEILRSLKCEPVSPTAHAQNALTGTVRDRTAFYMRPPPELLSLIACAFRGFKKETLTRPNLDEFLDVYENLLKKTHPPAI